MPWVYGPSLSSWPDSLSSVSDWVRLRRSSDGQCFIPTAYSRPLTSVQSALAFVARGRRGQGRGVPWTSQGRGLTRTTFWWLADACGVVRPWRALERAGCMARVTDTEREVRDVRRGGLSGGCGSSHVVLPISRLCPLCQTCMAMYSEQL